MDLETRAVAQFDRLLNTGELHWKDTPPRRLSAEPFDFEFRVNSSLTKKPIDTSQKEPPKTAAFSDPNPDFTLGQIGPKHKLILNKFCVVRPQFVLPTIEYEPQSDALNEVDFSAAWDVLCRLSEKYMAMFNCGVNAGSSLGHKHMQVIPLPQDFESGFWGQFEDENKRRKMAGTSDLWSLVDFPFLHAAYELSSDIGAAGLAKVYDYMRKAMGLSEGKPHNMLLTKSWLVVVPRSKAWMGGGEMAIAGNAAGMVGIVWCKSEEQYQGWMEYGPMKALRDFGVSLEGASS